MPELVEQSPAYFTHDRRRDARRRPVPRSEGDGPPGALLTLRPSQRSHYLRLGQDVPDDDHDR